MIDQHPALYYLARSTCLLRRPAEQTCPAGFRFTWPMLELVRELAPPRLPSPPPPTPSPSTLPPLLPCAASSTFLGLTLASTSPSTLLSCLQYICDIVETTPRLGIEDGHDNTTGHLGGLSMRIALTTCTSWVRGGRDEVGWCRALDPGRCYIPGGMRRAVCQWLGVSTSIAVR